MLKEQKGITLVALIITIIVMLILAGVSISLVVGDNGVLKQAQSVEPAQVKGALREAIGMAGADMIAAVYGDSSAANYVKPLDTDDAIKAYIERNFNGYDDYAIDVDGTTVTATKDGEEIKVTMVKTTKEVNGVDLVTALKVTE